MPLETARNAVDSGKRQIQLVQTSEVLHSSLVLKLLLEGENHITGSVPTVTLSAVTEKLGHKLLDVDAFGKVG